MCPTGRQRGGADDFDEEACSALLARVASTSDPAWRGLAGVLWPELDRLVRGAHAMAVLARSEDHVRSAVLLVLEKLGRDGCRAAHLERPWRQAHPGKTLRDWLRILTANVARDYVRERRGRAKAAGASALDKRLLASLATLLPDEDGLGPAEMLSHTSGQAARELARWADEWLPPDQCAALTAWLQSASFEEIASDLGLLDAAAAERKVRAARAALRRHAGVE